MGIYVWGTGCGASELIEQGLPLERITAFVDSFSGGEAFLGKAVLLPEQLVLSDCELLIVTTRHTDAVALRCGQLGIPESKLLFLKNNYELSDRNAACSVAQELLGTQFLKKLFPKQRIVPTPAALANSMLPQRDLSNDYVRLATLELLCRRLDGVPGAAAELGVYKGFFARCINQLLPERKLYLFDSFEGFAEEANASQSFQAAHANTTIEKVLAIMPHPEMVTVKPGFFPASLNGLEEKFCLVSLDVDFAQATLDGLRYFWPRLQKGGYLMLHDWG
ncbi:MAG: TylF/MycF/NovP-related O-methyltransferase, partial [Planctomycetia bacterium]|nr:TylF/MycF/NovP-related O-methyltransferase [Planctomycetia bacterium]